MNLYDKISIRTSKSITNAYSTSFSMGIRLFNRRYHKPIYAVYGFVRLADEIVDTFHDSEQRQLLDEFTRDTWQAIERGISLNPVLHSFQKVVNEYNIDKELIATFLQSMEMDLEKKQYDISNYEKYILGSAEVVGLMCLKVFVRGNEQKYQELKYSAMRLGSAFQKINFLRDIHADYQTLGRSYFPGVDISRFDEESKRAIESDIEKDFQDGYAGIKKLPQGVRLGVYIAYRYFYALFRKIQRTRPNRIMKERIRVPNTIKYTILFKSVVRHSFNIL